MKSAEVWKYTSNRQRNNADELTSAGGYGSGTGNSADDEHKDTPHGNDWRVTTDEVTSAAKRLRARTGILEQGRYPDEQAALGARSERTGVTATSTEERSGWTMDTTAAHSGQKTKNGGQK
ncbi:hypothetical protein QTP88_002059 [Uroleucon formosanum]